MKLDSRTPFSALWAATLLEKAGLPPGLLALVTGSGEQLGPPLIDRVDYVMFTGSTRVGREVAARCAERLIGCSLELGGKNAMLVLDDADIERAAEGARKGSFSHAGQMCVGMERIYVHEDVYEPFARRLVELTRGDARRQRARRTTTRWGRCSRSGSSRRSRRTSTDAVGEGRDVLAGGRRAPGRRPVLLRADRAGGGDARDDAAIAEETFGPVVSLYRVRLRRRGGRAAPMRAATGSTSACGPAIRSAAAKLARPLEAGTVNVNEAYGAAWCSVERADGRHQGLGARPPARRARDQKYTEAADGRRAARRCRRGAARCPAEAVGYAPDAGMRILRRVPGVR